MERVIVKIGDRKIPLRFRMREFKQIEEEIGPFMEVRNMIIKGKNRIRNTIGVIRIMGNGGLKEEGQEPDLTDEWLEENMDPFSLTTYQVAVVTCLANENASEAAKEKNENKERDLVLEEIEEKKDPVN